MTKNKTERTIECERLDGNTIIAHVEKSYVCVIRSADFYRFIPRDVIIRGLRRGKSLKRSIASEKREIRRQWTELEEASAPWAGLINHEQRKKSEP